MTSGESAAPTRAGAVAAVAGISDFAADFALAQLEPAERAALDLVLIDTLGVIVAGARTREFVALASTFGGAGPNGSRIPGTDLRLPVDAAAFLIGTASCMLELDEGNKHARGHPAAHAIPAVLALAASTGATARSMLEAILVGHEVAARFGRAVRLKGGFHPHGNWGVPGAAAAAAKLTGCSAEETAGAIDAAAGLALANPFDAALQGTFVRNTWIGTAAVSGIHSARLARAGLATNDGTAVSSFGRLIGSFDPTALTDQLGTRLDISLGYLKVHASCSFTHPPIDAALALREDPRFDRDRIVDVEVRTHKLAVALDRPGPGSRLAAMFSIPFLVAVALRTGRVDVDASGDQSREDARIGALAERVRVVHEPAHDDRAPAERPAEVIVTMADGEVLTCAVPNPVGDADHHPLDRTAVESKLETLIGGESTGRIVRAIDSIHTDDERPAQHLLDGLP